MRRLRLLLWPGVLVVLLLAIVAVHVVMVVVAVSGDDATRIVEPERERTR